MKAVCAAEKLAVSDENARDVGWSCGHEVDRSCRVFFRISCTSELLEGAMGQLMVCAVFCT